MDTMMKVCGKSPSNTAKAFAVDANGVALYKHVWETANTLIVNEAVTDMSGHLYPAGTENMDVRDYAIISLGVRNRANAPVIIRITDAGNYLNDSHGEPYMVTIPANTDAIITADDFPCLNVLPSFQIRYQYSSVPTNSGKLMIRLFKKR